MTQQPKENCQRTFRRPGATKNVDNVPVKSADEVNLENFDYDNAKQLWKKGEDNTAAYYFTLQNSKVLKTKISVMTNVGKVVLENFDYDKAKQLISAISSSGLEITNIKETIDTNARGADSVQHSRGRTRTFRRPGTRHSRGSTKKVPNVQYKYNAWIEFIIYYLSWTLTCTLG